MADGGLTLIYRSLTTEDLLAKKDKLIDEIASLGSFTSGTVGNKSYARDVRRAEANVEAIIFVLNERSGAQAPGHLATDFSGCGRRQPESLNY